MVYEMKLFRHRKGEMNRGIEAIGGGGVSEAVRVEPDTKQSFHIRYVHSSHISKILIGFETAFRMCMHVSCPIL